MIFFFLKIQCSCLEPVIKVALFVVFMCASGQLDNDGDEVLGDAIPGGHKPTWSALYGPHVWHWATTRTMLGLKLGAVFARRGQRVVTSGGTYFPIFTLFSTLSLSPLFLFAWERSLYKQSWSTWKSAKNNKPIRIITT